MQSFSLASIHGTLPLTTSTPSLQAHADFTVEKVLKASRACSQLVTWVKKALALAACSTPEKRAQAALAAATSRLEAKQAQLDKAREAVAQLEGEVSALLAEQAAAAAGTSAAGGGHA